MQSTVFETISSLTAAMGRCPSIGATITDKVWTASEMGIWNCYAKVYKCTDQLIFPPPTL